MGAFAGGNDCHGFDVDEVAVLIVDFEKIGVAAGRWLYKTVGEVGEDFACVGGKVGVDEVEFVVGGFEVGGVIGDGEDVGVRVGRVGVGVVDGGEGAVTGSGWDGVGGG